MFLGNIEGGKINKSEIQNEKLVDSVMEKSDISIDSFKKEKDKIEDFIQNISEAGVDDPILKAEIINAKSGASLKIKEIYKRMVDVLSEAPRIAKKIMKIAVPVAALFVASHGEAVAQNKNTKDRDPITVHDPKDLNKKAYEDSLYLYNRFNNQNNELLEKGMKFKTVPKRPGDEENNFSNKPLNYHVFDLSSWDKKSVEKKGLIETSSEKKGSIKNWIPIYAKPVQPYVYEIPTTEDIPVSDVEINNPHGINGFTTGVPGYATIQVHSDQKGNPDYFVNLNGDKLPYSNNPQFTKEFAYPNFEPFKKNKKPQINKNEDVNQTSQLSGKIENDNSPKESDTIFVQNLNDPRLKEYQDSLFLFNNSKKVQEYYEKNGYTKKITPINKDYLEKIKNNQKHLNKIFNYLSGNPLIVDGPRIIKNNIEYEISVEKQRREVKTLEGKTIINIPEDEYLKMFGSFIKKMKPKSEMIPAGGLKHDGGSIDMDAPIQYINKNIEPDLVINYRRMHKGNHGFVYGNTDMVYTYDLLKIKPKKIIEYRIFDKKNETATPEKTQLKKKETPSRTLNGFTTGLDGYATIKVHYDTKGKPDYFVNLNGDKLPYSNNPQFTKKFSYPNSKIQKNNEGNAKNDIKE